MCPLGQADEHQVASNARSYITQDLCPVVGALLVNVVDLHSIYNSQRMKCLDAEGCKQHLCCTITVTLPSYVLPRVVRMTSGAR